jgi:hypothetical protein
VRGVWGVCGGCVGCVGVCVGGVCGGCVGGVWGVPPRKILKPFMINKRHENNSWHKCTIRGGLLERKPRAEERHIEVRDPEVALQALAAVQGQARGRHPAIAAGPLPFKRARPKKLHRK